MIQYAARHQAQQDGVHDVALGGEQAQAGVQAVDHQRRDYDGHRAVPGDAQGEQGNERGAGAGQTFCPDT